MNLEYYKQRFNLQRARFSPIIHPEAHISLVYKVTPMTGNSMILKICAKKEEFYFLDNLPDLWRSAFLKGYESIRPIPEYTRILPLLSLGRALAVVGFTVASNTWKEKNQNLYQRNKSFVDTFPFGDHSL